MTVPAPVFKETLPLGPVRQKYVAFVYNTNEESHWRGGFGTGKTTALVQRHGLMRLKYPGSPGLIARSNLTIFNRTTLRNFLKMWRDFGVYKKVDARFEWFNGSVTDFFGLDVPDVEDALKSYEPLDVCIDEADEITQFNYALAKGRARWQPIGDLLDVYLERGLTKYVTDAEGIERLQLPHRISSISNFNGRDWIYYRFKDGRGSGRNPDLDARMYWEATTLENHSLPANYVENLLKETDKGPEFVKRFVYGDDSVAFGRILFKLNAARDELGQPAPGGNLYSPAAIPAHWPQYLGVDVGYKHPTAGLVARVGEDGRIWITDEYLQAERTSLENARAIKSMGGTVPIERTYGSPDASKTDQTSGRSALDDYRDVGIPIVPAALNHDDSINTINQYLESKQLEPGLIGKPKLMISTSCTRLIKQLEGYTWEMRRKKSTGSTQTTDPDGGDWDLYDCLRMLVCSIPIDARAESFNLTPNRTYVPKRQGGY